MTNKNDKNMITSGKTQQKDYLNLLAFDCVTSCVQRRLVLHVEVVVQGT